MGAFFLCKKNNETSISKIERDYKQSLDVFKRKGLRLNVKIEKGSFCLFLYHKYSFDVENYYGFENGDFIASTGTYFYNGTTGINSLKNVFLDFKEGKNIINKLNGNYCFIIFYKNVLNIFNDYLGLYRVYRDVPNNVFSNSFISLSKALEDKTISEQEIYEYIFHGAFYGDDTFYKEVKLLSSKYIWEIIPSIKKIQKEHFSKNSMHFHDFHEMLNLISNTQIGYFKMIKCAWKDKVTSALSGGFDTRLMLAISKKVGLNPKLYVYGSDKSSDVKIAKNVTSQENLTLDHIDRGKYPQMDSFEYLEILKKNYYYLDGLGITGIFDNGSDIDTRVKRSKSSLLHINGGGGEIYRNFWELRDKKYTIRNFLKSKYDFFDYSLCTEKFNKEKYFSNFERKIKIILSIDKNKLTRKQIESLYPFLRLKYWMGMNNSINNQFSFSLTPFVEPEMFYPSFNIPLKFKNSGVFQAALIREMDTDISKYQSDYGFNFYDKIGLKYKIKDYARVNTPIFLRRIIRKRKRSNTRMPYFLNQDYLLDIVRFSQLSINKYINVEKINNPEVLSRVLTLELFINNKFD
jgi:asparagine synthase (glutamine-hydrolysing)